MSKESAIQFLKQFRGDKNAEEIMKSKGKCEDSKSMAQALSEVASEMGKEISPEDFAKALDAFEAEMRQNTDSVISGIEALKDEELENVSGGKHKPGDNACRHDHNGRCWGQDACISNHYYYACDNNYNDMNCTLLNFCDGFWNGIRD